MPGTKYTIELDVKQTAEFKRLLSSGMGLKQAAEAAGFGGGGGTSGGSKVTNNADEKQRMISNWAIRQQIAMTQKNLREINKMGSIDSMGSGVNWKMFGMGALAAPFSPWVAARSMSMSGAFGMGGGGSGGGGGGGLMGSLFGQGGFGGFMTAYIALQTVMRGLRFAFEELTAAFHRGAQLYLKAAEIGTTTTQTSQLQKTASILGMSENALTNLMASGQFMRGQRFGAASLGGAILGGGRGVGGKEDLQAIRNLSVEVQTIWAGVAEDAKLSGMAAKALFISNVKVGELKSAWNSLMEGLAADMSPAKNVLVMAMTGWVRFFEFHARKLLEILQGIGFISKGTGEEFQQFNPMKRLQTSPWEKMGLVIGDSRNTDYAKQTAENTLRIALILSGARTRNDPDFFIPAGNENLA